LAALAALVLTTAAVLRAQDGALGTAFPLYVANQSNTIVKVDPFGTGSVFTSGGSIFGPEGLAFDASGNLGREHFRARGPGL
jgi:hypothetical protein